jgi:serine/threonine protein kinase
MFLDEARLSSRLTHPNIAQVFDFGEDAGTLYLAMELVPGVPLTRAQQWPPLESAQIAHVGNEIALALDYAHGLNDSDGAPLGIVHRDVSPHNIMVTFQGGLKIIDFGIAHVRDRETPATQTGQMRGKPGYMAPEQVTGDSLDARTDVFQLGVVLWELSTGEKLFPQESLSQFVYSVVHQAIPSPRDRRPDLDENLAATIAKALKRSKSERFQSCAELSAALTPIVDSSTPASFRELVTANVLEEERFFQDFLKSAVNSVEVQGRAVGVGTAVKAEDTLSETLGPTRVLTPGADESPSVRSSMGKTLAGLSVALIALSSATYFVTQPDSDAGIATEQRGAEPAEIVEADVSDVAVTSADGAADDLAVKEPIVDEAAAPKKATRQKRRRGPRHPPKEKPSSVADSKGYGTLRITAKPWANVVIDGKNVGATPLFGHQVPSGEHVVELLDPRTRNVVLRRRVDVATGKNTAISYP